MKPRTLHAELFFDKGISPTLSGVLTVGASRLTHTESLDEDDLLITWEGGGDLAQTCMSRGARTALYKDEDSERYAYWLGEFRAIRESRGMPVYGTCLLPHAQGSLRRHHQYR